MEFNIHLFVICVYAYFLSPVFGVKVTKCFGWKQSRIVREVISSAASPTCLAMESVRGSYSGFYTRVGSLFLLFSLEEKPSPQVPPSGLLLRLH